MRIKLGLKSLRQSGTIVASPPSLGDITLSSTSFAVGTPSSGTLIGSTGGSTLTDASLPSGLTIDTTARTWAWDGTGTASTGSLTITETLAGATGSPKTSTISYTISGGATSTLAAPMLGYPSPIASNPTSIAVTIPVDWQSGDVLVLARSASSSMSSPTLLTHTLTDADISAGTFSIGLSGVTLSGVTYFQAYGRHSGADSANKSALVAWGDTTAPVITTSSSQSVTETTQLAVTLTATDTGGVPALVSDGTSPGWYIAGGADQLQFQIAIVSGTPKLQWYANGTQSYASPTDNGLNNVYDVAVVAKDYGGNATSMTISVTVAQADLTPDAFTFTDVSNATLSTLYTSNTITVSGVSGGGVNVPTTVSAGEYQKNGGAWTAAGSFNMQLGDTLAVRATSSGSYSTGVNVVVTIGTVSDTYTVTTMVNPAAAGFTPSSSQPADHDYANTTNVGTFSADFVAAGRGVVYVKPYGSGRLATGVKIKSAGAAGADITCTKLGGSSSGDDFTVWVGNADIASSGTFTVEVTWSAFVQSVGVLCGTLSNTTTPTSPVGVVTVEPVSFYTTYPIAAASPITIPTNGVGVCFSDMSGPAPHTANNSATIISSDPAGIADISRRVATGSWTPSVAASGNGYGSLIAVVWGP